MKSANTGVDLYCCGGTLNKHRSLLGGILFLLLNISIANATPALPAASGTLHVGGSLEPDSTIASYSDQATFAGSPVVLSDNDAVSSASAAIGLAPWPSLNLQMVVAAGGNSGATAALDYWIEIFSPNPSVSSVPVLVSTKLTAGGYETLGEEVAYSQAFLDAPSDPPNTPLYGAAICDADQGIYCGFLPAGFDETDTVSFPVNEAIHVTLSANANISSCNREFIYPPNICPGALGPGELDMFVGMTFQIDPAFVAVDPGYALLVSAGVGPDLVVDEPLTLSLLGAGAAMLALLSRRKRIAMTSSRQHSRAGHYRCGGTLNKHLSLLGGLPLLLLDVSAAGAAPVLPDATGSASEGGDQEQFFPPGFYSGQTTFAGRPGGSVWKQCVQFSLC